MKVVVWPALGRVGAYATGVGKHVLRMSTGLATQPGWDTRLLFTSDLWARDQVRRERSEMDRIPGIRLPFSRRVGEAVWRTTRRPKVDRWLDAADWVYCPKELYIPTASARSAITVHDLFRIEPAYRALFPRLDFRWKWLLQRALREADLVLAVSEFTKARIVDLIGISEEKIRVVGNGVDEGFFAIGDADPAAATPYPGQPYVLAVGGVTHKKGGGALLGVVRALQHVAPGLKVVVTGPVAPEFAGDCTGLSNLILVQRGFPDPEMHRLVRGATAALVLSEYEGFGIPALEAMAAGVPVVAARRAALPEVVGDAAVLVEPGDARGIAETLADLHRDSKERSSLIERGRARARGYTWSACVERLATALIDFGPRSADRRVGQ